jgi:uncharacterized protein YecT (DUF1311 family)
MKLFPLFFIFYMLSYSSAAQSSVVDIYEAHTFPCDSIDGNWEANMCSGEKADFADSLLNRLYKEILRSLDKEIAKDQVALKRAKANTKTPDKDEIRMRATDIDHNQRLKQSIINSQRQWIKTRDTNLEVEQINCEGGSGCIAIVNQALVEETLDRIRKLESFVN